MKKNLFLLIFFLASVLPTATATHMWGGEISWECQPNGEVVFALTLYRDAGAVPLPGTATINVYNNPNLSSMLATAVDSMCAAPGCNGASLSCANGDYGAVEVIRYETAPQQLTGVPGANGWIFAYENCCRPVSTNLPSTPATSIMAIMHAYNGQNMFPCFDNSPVMEQPTNYWNCAGDTIQFNHLPSDPDLDSLTFEMHAPQGSITGTPTNNNPSPVPMVSGYSANNPFGGYIDVNPTTGAVTYSTTNLGYFATNTRVASYRNGQLIAEVFRDIMFTVSNCSGSAQPVLTDAFNSATPYADTVAIGDTISFSVNGLTGGNQAIGTLHGSQVADDWVTTTNCGNPSCATISVLPSVSYNWDSALVNFTWAPTADVISSDYNNHDSYTFHFLVEVDNGICPIPNLTRQTISITVVGPNMAAPELLCTAYDNNTGSTTINWNPPADPDSVFAGYVVYYAPDVNTALQPIDTILNYGDTTATYTDAAAANGVAVYGIAAMSSNGGSSAISQRHTLFLEAAIAPMSTDLTWNMPFDAINAGYTDSYYDDPSLGWQFVTSTTFQITQGPPTACAATQDFYVEMNTNLGCVSVSNVASATNTPPTVSALGDTAICLGDSALVSAMALPANQTYNYSWTPAAGASTPNQSSTWVMPSTTTTYSVAAETTPGCSHSDSVTVTVNQPQGTGGPDETICPGDSVTLSASGAVGYSWTPATNVLGANTANPTVWPANSTDYVVAMTDANGCISADTVEVAVAPAAMVDAGNDTTICAGGIASLQSTGGAQIVWSPAATLNNSNTANPLAMPTVTTTYTVGIIDANGCWADDQVTVFVDTAISASVTTWTNGLTGAAYSELVGGDYYWELDGIFAGNSDSIGLNFPSEGSYYVCLAVTNACGSDTACTELLVFDSDSVWPGDANYDGVVDNLDLLPIGLGFGSTGPVRPGASIMWQAQPAWDWTQTFPAWDNYKHADCNGDGTINAADTTAISQNYMLTHNKFSGVPSATAVDPLLYIQMDQDTSGLSQAVTANIMLGDAAVPASMVYGLAFTIHYDNQLLDSASIFFSSNDSWLGTKCVDMIDLQKNFYSNGEMHVALTRTDLTEVNGMGKIAELGGITADNLSGKVTDIEEILTVSISNVTLIGANGNDLPFSTAADSLLILETADGLPGATPAAPALYLFPNPADNHATLRLSDGAPMDVVTVHDATGRFITRFRPRADVAMIPTGSLATGIYIVEVQSNAGVSTKRLVISR